MQAGSHPFAQTVSLTFNSKTDAARQHRPAGNVKDIQAELPPGLIAIPTRFPSVRQRDFIRQMTSNARPTPRSALHAW